ncbi:MAG: hypothetical protein KF718_19975 [Polyangiaceae bacterium]|nr:hypothetical protein [Polyangiaceae bacterium]
MSDFFGNVVGDAIRARGLDTTDAAETYVVGLLVDYARPDQLSEETLSRPLTLLLDEAMRASGHERFERLRSLGDGVLYVSGFFAEHLHTRGVERHYVSSVGARAYESAAAMLRTSGAESSGPDVFAELAQKFRAFADLLAEVADALAARAARSDRAMLRVYERWLETGSASLADALTSRGLVPVRGSGTVH